MIVRFVLSTFNFATHCNAALIHNCHDADPTSCHPPIVIKYVRTANSFCGKVKPILPAV